MDTLLNNAITATDNALRTLFAKPHATRACPTVPAEPTELNAEQKASAGALMRVNHVGEVCAQALYAAQALSTRDPVLRQQFLDASREESDHLAWTHERLDHASRAIVAQMKDDEARHAREAANAGAQELPLPVKALMRASAKLMTTTAQYI